MHSIGELTASAEAEVSDMGTDALLVYPAGPVTLRLQVSLPPGAGWYDDKVSITYMACSQSTCRPPVIGKQISVRVPGLNNITLENEDPGSCQEPGPVVGEFAGLTLGDDLIRKIVRHEPGDRPNDFDAASDDR